MNIALIGNQNSGKTTLFNKLTGSHYKVGNFPGVTVEGKSGLLKNFKESINLIDLPGIYSLSPYSKDEMVTRDYLLSGEADAIINILDATNLERNLYLTIQLLSLEIPMILAFNMMDEVKNNGMIIDFSKISASLGLDIVPISALKGEGIMELAEKAVKIAKEKNFSGKYDICEDQGHRTIHSIEHMIEDHVMKAKIPMYFAAIKLIEGDKPIVNALKLSENELEFVEHAIQEFEAETKMERYEALVLMRYTFIENLCQSTVKKLAESKEYIRSLKIDKILTHKYFGLPLFFAIMFLIFYLTFGLIGKFLSDILALGIEKVTEVVDTSLVSYGLNPVIKSLIVDGVFAGVGAVVAFLPVIVILFFFLSLLEDSGYMTRIAFMMDRLLRKIGLSGKSFVPMLIGFGCTVPAVLATRTLSSERDRKMTIFLMPFFSCSAKLPIYALFCVAFFPKSAPLVMISLYALGIGLAILAALVMNKFRFKGDPIPFVLEMPNYRLPSLDSSAKLMWEKAKDFLQKAFTIIFLATIIIWFLQNFDFALNPLVEADDKSASMLARIGKFIAPLFSPLGFGSWEAVTALVSGFTAKEAVISSLAILTQNSVSDLESFLPSMFSPLAAFSFLVFILLYTPCIAAVRTIKNEFKSRKAMLLLITFQILIAYIVALLIFQIGTFLGG